VTAPPEPTFSAQPPGGEQPLSFAQQRMWFLHQYDTEGDVQNNVFYAIELSGPLAVDALRHAFEEIARRHAALRTRFGQRDGVPYQIVDPHAGIAIPLTEVERGELKARIDAHARHVFDLETGPLWKVDVLRLKADEHVLLINMHHIVCDGPSFRIVFRELTALYNASIDRAPLDLPVPSGQYTDYVIRERQRIDEGLLDADLDYWRERLRGAPELLALPTDRPRPATATHSGATVAFELSEELVARLKELRRREGTSLFKTLLAAFQLLMWRYSNLTDILVAAPVAVRTQPELEGVVGFFINTLPFRIQIDPNERFSALLGRVTATVLEAQDHQEIPFDYLVSELSPQRSLAHNPIVQVVFALQREALSALRLAGLEARRLAQDNAAARFDISLSVYERADDIVGTCEYRTDLFDRATVERLLDHYRRLLEAIVADPDERVSRYDLLSADERRQILVDWNRNAIPVPEHQTMHGLVEAQDPGAVALVFEGTQLTYGELNARANQLAHSLIERGVRPDARVGLCIDRSLEQMIGLLGIQKAGGAYVPLDPSYPKERLDYIADDAKVQCVVYPEDVRAAMARYPDHPPQVKVLPQNLAYVIYTSGSTGRPKGVMLAHRGAVNLAYAAQKVFGELPGSRILQFASLSFDTSVWEIVMTWIRGGALVLGPKERMLPGEELVALMNEAGVDRATLPPAALAALDPRSLPKLKVLISAGEALSLAQVMPWLEGRTVFNGYGPTESTVGAAIGPVSADEPITIGRPFANIALYILDRNLQPVPVGVAGELCIGGASLARGYLHRPELTAEKFVPNPFGSGRLYRTGDMVRYRPDGKIEFVGRTDHQVKIRGFRIELGEVEATIERHPAIAKSLVIATGEGESKRLVAYHTPKPGQQNPSASDLRTFLKKTLPEHMVPSFFIALDAFPLTPSDKIDRAALPAPDFGAIEGEYTAPRTPAEETLAAIWQQVLRMPRVGVHDHFFEIGGHSLLATQVVSRINDAFSLALPVRVLFEASDIESLGRRIEEAQATGRIARLPLRPVPRGAVTPLSFAQQRLWFLSKLEGPSSTYSAPAVMRLRGSLDEEALLRALRSIVTRHEVLRTRFREIGGVPMQEIDGGDEIAMRRRRASTPEELASAIDEELHDPFDLSGDALLRILLIEEEPGSHVLVLNLHHSIADGWSLGVLMKELSALYGCSPLPPLPIQYADFAYWQREWLSGEVLASETDYWKTALANLPPLLELPTDRPRPPVQSYCGTHEPFRLSRELTDQLRALSQKSGATLFMTLLAAFDILLSRYSGQTDIAVGTPVANRSRPELESLIGFFINNLVLRADLSGDPTFNAFLRRVRETALNAYAHQDVPFEHLVEQLNPARSLSYAPLFQVMLVLQNAPFSALRLGEVEITSLPHEHRATKFDLTLSLTETEAGLDGALEYSTDLFDRATVVRFLYHYRRLLEAIVADPDERVSRYELLSADERRQILVDWNRNAIPVPEHQTMHGLVEAQAEQNPDAIALVFEGAQLTYREFNARANQLAHSLIERGVGPDARVGLCIDRSLEQMIGMVGIQKAGGAYVPLDPSYPKERLDYIAEDARAQCVVYADDVRAAIARYPDHAPAVQVLPQNLAYVIYTSGSTGRPKGVMLMHRGAVNLAYAAQKVLDGLPGSRVLQFASLSFDTSVWEIVGAWIRGSALVLGPKERMLPGTDLIALMNEQGVDLATLPPAALAAVSPQSLPRLKTLISAGEALSLAQVTPWLEGRTVLNGYGPTESTVGAAIGIVSGDEPITIGRPFANIALYILDRTLQSVPVGVAGELCISGASLARGYLDRPDLTAEKFVPNPFGTSGSRMYRTGDVVRYRPNGKIEFVGRTDHQVKIRGFRIELGEIEATLERHPAIAKSLVIATGEGESKRLIAYTTAKPGDEAPPPSELRTLLKKTLPEHMVPSFFIALDAFPLTPSDKIDRAALPAPDLAAIEGEYTAPRTPVEQTLAGIWQQVLRVPRVGVHDHFFEIGGHSLLATQVVSRINDAFSLALPVRVLFEAPDIESLGRCIEEAQAAGRIARLPLRPVPRGAVTPLSFAQQRLWFLSKLEGPSYTYNIPVTLRLRGRLDEEALVRALETIVERHEVLRTRFREADGVPRQVIDPAGNFVVRRERLPASGALTALVDDELHHRFDLSRDELFRARLIEEGPDSHVLILNLHHSIADGWSVGVLMNELKILYEGSPLSPLLIQYADFAYWQREWLTGEVLAAETDYWKTALADLPPLLELPTDRPRPPSQSYRGAHEPFHLSRELTDQLRTLTQKSGATLFMTLLAAFDILLSRTSGQTDIAVGTPVANRSRPELEPLIGFFINTLVLRADLTGDPTFIALLAQVRDTALNAYAHQDVPFEFLVEALKPARSLSHSPLFQVTLLLQNAPFSPLRLPDLEVTPLRHEQRSTKFDLSLSLTETESGLDGALEYSTDLFDRATVVRLLDHYRRLLEAIVADPDERVSRYELLSEDERRQILVDWNRNAIPVPENQTMHGLVEAQAAQNPDGIALVFEGARLTYREFNARANQLAHYLIERGVGPDTRVGLCIDRSLEQMIGMLGIQKAGGAYVPLDPSYPKERLDYIAEDAKAQCVVYADDVRAAIARYPDHSPEVRVLPQNLAYVIYTSGSTGRPKGVMLMHRGAVNLAYAAQKVFDGLPGSRILQFASLSFDTSVWEIVMTWIRGGALVLGPKERMLPGADLAALMNEAAVDRATLPPAALAALNPDWLPNLKVLISAGEALSLAQVTPWLEGRTVLNGYGPTESTVGAAIGVVSGDEPITIGRPFANIALYILDRSLQPVPVGVAGELCVGGASLARGYLDRPDLTAEKFVPNPFGAPGSRMYRTGDVVRYRPDGKIEFVGRTDHQVKIRGFRIELGEIEATLERHPGIAKSLVIATGEEESKRLVAYYTAKPDEQAPPPSELRTLLKKTLPEHMVPSFFIALDAFPLTPSDKIDRAALPAPDVAATFADQYAAARTPIEHTLVQIWEQVLRVPRIGVHDHFFEVGGHSLLVVQVITRIQQALNVEIAVIDLYKYPTVAALAEHVTRTASETRMGRDAASAASPLVVLSARETGAPLVVIPGIVGVLHGYYDFAQAVGELRPVYGLHALSMQEVDIRHTVESIARLYVSSLLEVWDRGPFHLLGHSYGGIIAFEMVRQLEQQGHRPGSLVLVDADPLALKMKELSPNAFVLRYMLRFLRLNDVAMPETAEALELADSERLATVLRDLVSRRDPDGSLGYEHMDQWVRTIQSRYIDAYAPAPYRPAAEVLEIWAQHGAMQRSDPSSMWQQVLQKATDRVVAPGDHESVIGREHAPGLARLVNDWIEKKARPLTRPSATLSPLPRGEGRSR
jgi:amino acid adenylation domain-containing protein